MNSEQPLPGLFITADQTAALEAMFSANFDIVILRHPNPAAFEAAMNAICTARPELVSRDFAFKSERLAARSTMITEITASDTALAGTSGYDEVRSWFLALREIAAKANPTLPTTHCSTRSIYDGSFSPFFGYHQDFSGDPVPDAPVQWRTVITLIGAGTKIIEEKKLKDACRRGTPKYEEAIRIAEAEFPVPVPPAVVQQSGFQSRKQLRVAQRKSDEAWRSDEGNKAHIQYIRLRRATRREEILLGDVPTVCARPGDMVFISQQRPKHLWHGSPQYTGGQRLGLVLDHIMVLNI